jgi:hypothetical protein
MADWKTYSIQVKTLSSLNETEPSLFSFFKSLKRESLIEGEGSVISTVDLLVPTSLD